MYSPIRMRVLLVDDFEPWRKEVRSMLQHQSSLQVIGEAENGREAIERTKRLEPDLVLLDLRLGDLNGLQVAEQISRACPNSKILLVTQYEDRQLANEGNVHGYILKSDCYTDLVIAINSVLGGERYISKKLSRLS